MNYHEEVRQKLSQVRYPNRDVNIVSLNMIKQIDSTEEKVDIHIILPGRDRKIQPQQLKIQLETQIRKILSKMYNPQAIKIHYEIDPGLKLEEDTLEKIKNIILVGSGKGGVGKSTVACNLAVAAKLLGYKVGLIDADIYGPSMGKMFGINGKVALEVESEKMKPLIVDDIKLISFSFLIEEKQPVVWRGPMLGKAIEQFLYDTLWGELDYLFIDLPPGTGDIQLSLGQLIKPKGSIIVSTPQSVALLDAQRAGEMFKQLKVPVLGIIENMSEFICPNCNHVSHIFSKDGSQTLSSNLDAQIIGKIPIDINIMKNSESGKPIESLKNQDIIYNIYKNIFINLENKLNQEGN